MGQLQFPANNTSKLRTDRVGSTIHKNGESEKITSK
jgi:hypothetical protein